MPYYKMLSSKRILKLAWINLTLVLFLGASPGAFEEAYEGLLSDIENMGIPVSITSCYTIDPDYDNEKLVYSMLLPPKNIKAFKIYKETIQGILIQKDKEGTVVNMAKLAFSTDEHSLLIADANGGVWTYKKLGEMANLMAKNNFSNITSKKIREALKVLPEQRCS